MIKRKKNERKRSNWTRMWALTMWIESSPWPRVVSHRCSSGSEWTAQHKNAKYETRVYEEMASDLVKVEMTGNYSFASDKSERFKRQRTRNISRTPEMDHGQRNDGCRLQAMKLHRSFYFHQHFSRNPQPLIFTSIRPFGRWRCRKHNHTSTHTVHKCGPVHEVKQF